jgi:hypothetical protein
MSKKEFASTQYKIYQLVEWVKENNRIPTTKEVQEIIDIPNINTARNYLRRLKQNLPEPDLTGLQRKILDRLDERLSDTQNPLDDSNLIKLLEFFIPKKSETKQMVEYTVNDENELSDELANYRKILFGTETSDTETL